MSRPKKVRLSVPERDRESPDFCDGTPGAIAEWVAALPFTDPVLTARELLSGLGELNACTTAFAPRFHQLEILRPAVHMACGGIARRVENQGLLRAESERREAGLAQRVQFQLALGYKMVIVDALRDGVRLVMPSEPEDDAGLVVIAIHRALTELTHTLLRSLQFYAPPPRRLWSQLHQLYYLAEVAGVSGAEVDDSENQLRRRTRVDDAYERALLLGAAHPNTLRQSVLGHLFITLEDWTREVGIAPAERAREPVILVNLQGDEPPVRASIYRHVAGEEPRSLETGDLVAHLNAFLEGELETDAPLARLDPANEHLIRHGSQVWGENSERTHPRRSARGEVEICVGMEAVHYYVGGGLKLEQQLQPPRQEKEQELILDPFLGASDTGGRQDPDARIAASQPRLPAEGPSTPVWPLSRLELTDAAPGGFGLICRGDAPEGLNTGELVGIREGDDPQWSVGVIRWCANAAMESRIGAALLLNHGISGGGRALSARTRGRTGVQWAPAILRPAVEALGEAPVLITRPECFEPGQKLAFNHRGRETRLIIECLVERSDAFARHEVRELGIESGAGADHGIQVEYISQEEQDSALAAFGLQWDES